MADSNSQPPRCPCGFWGSPQTLGLCSRCYKDHQKKNSDVDAAAPDTSMAGAIASALPTVLEPKSTTAITTTTVTVASGPQPSGASTKSSSSSSLPDEDLSSTSSLQTAKLVPDQDPSASSSGSSVTNGNGKRDASEVQEDEEEDTVAALDLPVQKSKKRCFQCNCKLELALREIGRCRCDYIFCMMHRLPEQHNCIYNHKEKGRQAAREQMVSPKKHIGTSLKRIDSDS